MPEEVQLQNSIAFTCRTRLTIAVNGDEQKLENGSSARGPDEEGDRSVDLRCVQASAIPDDD